MGNQQSGNPHAYVLKYVDFDNGDLTPSHILRSDNRRRSDHPQESIQPNMFRYDHTARNSLLKQGKSLLLSLNGLQKFYNSSSWRQQEKENQIKKTQLRDSFVLPKRI